MPKLGEYHIVIDGKGHLLGRLASIVAKSLLEGKHITVVRCEAINISGGFYRNKLKYLNFLRKRCNVNPKRGAFHFRAPSKIFLRTVRGMLPHKLSRGAAALTRLRAHEGVPPKYAKSKLSVVPSALRVVKLDPRRKYCDVGRLSHEVGWKYQNVIETLEARRKAQSALRYSRKRRDAKLLAKAKVEVVKKPKIQEMVKVIESYGYSL